MRCRRTVSHVRIVVCGLPILLYTLTRLARLLRYYLNARTVRILRAVVRPGQEESELQRVATVMSLAL